MINEWMILQMYICIGGKVVDMTEVGGSTDAEELTAPSSLATKLELAAVAETNDEDTVPLPMKVTLLLTALAVPLGKAAELVAPPELGKALTSPGRLAVTNEPLTVTMKGMQPWVMFGGNGVPDGAKVVNVTLGDALGRALLKLSDVAEMQNGHQTIREGHRHYFGTDSRRWAGDETACEELMIIDGWRTTVNTFLDDAAQRMLTGDPATD